MARITFLGLQDGMRCQKCGAEENLTRDHIWPKSKGGCSCQGNLEILCETCNSKKGNDLNERRGHRKVDCPQTKFEAFMSEWKAVRTSGDKGRIEDALVVLIEIRNDLGRFGCNPSLLSKAYTMVGVVKAEIRDFDQRLAERLDRKPKKISLEKLRRTEERLVEKLAEIRAQIREREAT